jgi:hypothetical protein
MKTIALLLLLLGGCSLRHDLQWIERHPEVVLLADKQTQTRNTR